MGPGLGDGPDDHVVWDIVLILDEVFDTIEVGPVDEQSDFVIASAPRLGLARALIKVKGTSLGEALAYRIAERLGVRTPRCVPLIVREPTRFGEQALERGAVVLLIEHLSDWTPVWLQNAVSVDAEQAARALAMRTYQWHEPGEFGTSAGELFYLDLEYALPRADAAWLTALESAERQARLAEAVDLYEKETAAAREEVLQEAVEVDLRAALEASVARVAGLTQSDWATAFALLGHPIGDELTDVLSTAVYRATQATVMRLRERD